MGFKHALGGLLRCLARERNMRIHLAAAFYVLAACAVTGAERWEWTCCVICIAAVLAAEGFNTALETLCDRLHPGRSDMIGAAKDIAAGAVLALAAGSAAVGGIIFFNRGKIEAALGFIRRHGLLAAAMLATLPVAVILIVRGYGHDKKNSHDHAGGQAERGEIDAYKRPDGGEGRDRHK